MPPTPSKTKEKKFGSFGWVKLTEEEHTRLLEDLGEDELNRCISYIDEQAQITRNRNKWRDWNLVLRRCSREHWGPPLEVQATRPTFHTEVIDGEEVAVRDG